MKDIIRIIEAQRVLQKVTRRDMAKAADITPEYYTKIIEYKCNPSAIILEMLVKRLDLELIIRLKM